MRKEDKERLEKAIRETKDVPGEIISGVKKVLETLRERVGMKKRY